MLLASAVVNMHASCLLMHVLAKKLQFHLLYIKDVANFCMQLHYTSQASHKDQDSLIEQSFICIYQQITGFAKKVDKSIKNLNGE